MGHWHRHGAVKPRSSGHFSLGPQVLRGRGQVLVLLAGPGPGPALAGPGPQAGWFLGTTEAARSGLSFPPLFFRTSEYSERHRAASSSLDPIHPLDSVAHIAVWKLSNALRHETANLPSPPSAMPHSSLRLLTGSTLNPAALSG